MTADLPEWAMEKAGAALGSPDFSRELLQIRIARALVAERERAAGIARDIGEGQSKGWRDCPSKDGCGGYIAASNTAHFIATAILSDGGPDA